MANCSLSGHEQRMGTSLAGLWGWSSPEVFPRLFSLFFPPTLQVFLSFYRETFSTLQSGSLMVTIHVVLMHHHCSLHRKRWAKFSPNLLPWDSCNNWWQSVLFLLLFCFAFPSPQDLSWFTGVVWVVEVQGSEVALLPDLSEIYCHPDKVFHRICWVPTAVVTALTCEIISKILSCHRTP